MRTPLLRGSGQGVDGPWIRGPRRAIEYSPEKNPSLPWAGGPLAACMITGDRPGQDQVTEPGRAPRRAGRLVPAGVRCFRPRGLPLGTGEDPAVLLGGGGDWRVFVFGRRRPGMAEDHGDGLIVRSTSPPRVPFLAAGPHTPTAYGSPEPGAVIRGGDPNPPAGGRISSHLFPAVVHPNRTCREKSACCEPKVAAWGTLDQHSAHLVRAIGPRRRFPARAIEAKGNCPSPRRAKRNRAGPCSKLD